MMNDKVTNLCEIISIFHSEQFLELVIDDIRTTPNLLTSLVLTTLHNTETTHLHTGPHTFIQDVMSGTFNWHTKPKLVSLVE